MNAFPIRDGEMVADDVPVRRIAAEVGTPFYCYASSEMERRYAAYADAFAAAEATVLYAIKANGNQSVIRTLGRCGAGADVVSEGELRRALAAGIPADRIVFSGVGKTGAELAAGLEAGILQFNVESEAELHALAAVAAARGVAAPVALRVNPAVDATSHDKISTGRRHDKFGIPWDRAEQVYSQAAALPGIRITGIAVHIGSQIVSLDPFARAFRAVTDLARALQRNGHDIVTLDLGGGLGIRYVDEAVPAVADYAALAIRETAASGCRLLLEPGRSLVGPAGILVTSVVYEKDSGGRRIVVVDAAMNDLIRPAMYGATHGIVPVTPDATKAGSPADVVGPVCESGDTFARERALPATAPGDLLAILTAGAYGAVMASSYNSRPLVPEVLVHKGEFAVVRPRPTNADLIAADRVAPWLA